MFGLRPSVERYEKSYPVSHKQQFVSRTCVWNIEEWHLNTTDRDLPVMDINLTVQVLFSELNCPWYIENAASIAERKREPHNLLVEN